MNSDGFYDDLEVRSADERANALADRLPVQIANAQERSTAFKRLLQDVDPVSINSREALQKLPVIRKGELIELQKKSPPFGGLSATPVRDLARVFSSPGPIYEPEARRNDYWRMARALFAAGFRRGDLVHNTFAYHFTPAGFMMESGAHSLGCPVFPAGTGNTEQQAQAINHLRPVAYAGTPSFLKIIIDKADELDLDASSLKKAMVSGEALPESLRTSLGSDGIDVRQCYATADVGLIAYESAAAEGMISDEEIVLELVSPGTGDPVKDGEVGEVLVTSLNPDYPLVRFATGDLSAALDGVSPCGRTNLRIKGWMGRADQTTKVRGMFVHPGQIASVVKRHPEMIKARLIVDREDVRDTMLLQCAVSEAVDGLEEAVASSVQEICKLRCDVALVESDALPNDGKVIDDVRRYD